MSRFRRSAIALLGLAVLAYGAVVVWLVANETQLVFASGRPMGNLRPRPPLEIVQSTQGGVDRLMWVMRANAADNAPWAIFLHGNGATIAARMNIVHYERLRALGVNVLAPEYRGFGGMAGTPTEPGIEDDARRAYAYLRERLHVDPRRIVIYGWSLGSAVAIDLAARGEEAAVILEGAPASIVAIGQQRYPLIPVRLIIRNPFESIAKIDKVRAPKLFIHSGADLIVPISEGRRLFDAAPPPKEWVEVAGGHVYAAEQDPAFFDHVRAFLVEQRLLERQ